MASLKFDITGNASGFVAATREVENASSKMCQSVSKEGNSLDGMFKTLAASAAAFFSIQYGKELVNQIIEVRGEFQQLEIAFETMLGDADEANALMNQLTQTAAKTPFGLTDVANGAKQLLAYGVSAEEVNETLIRLGDIASGLSIPLNDLVFLYGSTMVQGRVFTQDMRQFMGRGIPLAEELAKKFGVTKNEINEMVSQGKIGFYDMKEGLWAMTSEGGKFYNLMEKQSSSLTGQMSNLEDSVDMMLNEIGQKSQDILANGISMLSWLVENYKKLGKMLITIAATYGTYRAALIAATIQEKVAALARLAHIKNTTLLGLATDALKVKMAALNAVMKKNPWGLAISAAVALAGTIWTLSDNTSQAEKTQEAYNKLQEDATQKAQEHADAIQGLIDKVNDETVAYAQRQAALQNLQNLYPQIFAQYDIESLKLADILSIQKQINEEKRKEQRSESLSNFYYKEASYKAYDKVGWYPGKGKDKDQAKADMDAAFMDFYNYVFEDMAPALDSAPIEELTRYLNGLKSGEHAFQPWRDGKVNIYKDFSNYIKNNKPADPGEYFPFMLNRDDTTGLYDTLISMIESEITSRTAQEEADKNKPIYGVDYEAAKKEWETAKKELEKIEKDKDKFTTEQYKAAVEKEEEKKKAFEALGGKTNARSTKNTAQDEQANYESLKLKYGEEEIRQAQDIANKTEQASINALADGAEKRRRQRELDNKIELQQIKRSKEDFIDAYVEREKAIFDAEEKVNAAKTKDYKKKTFDEAASRAKAASSEGAKKYDVIYSYTQAKQQTEGLEELRSKYEDFAQAVKRIDSELAEEMSQMKNADGTLVSGFSQENIDLAVKKAEEAKDALAVQYVESEEEFQVFVKSLADKTIKELEVMLAEAEKELSSMDTSAVDPDELAKARAEVAKLKEQLKALKVDKGVKESEVNWTDLNKVLSESADKFSELGEIIPGITGQTLAGIGSIATAAIGVANGITAIGKAVSAAEKASAVLAVVSAVISVIQKLTAASEENAAANEAASNAARDYSRALDEISYAERRGDFDSVFGSDNLGVFAANVKIATEQLGELQSMLDSGTGWDIQDQMKLSNKTSGWGTFSKDLRDSLSAMHDLMDRALVSDMRSAWQRFWGTGNDNLQVVSLDDFIDEDGMLDSERLRAWYEAYGEGLTDEQKNIVEDLLAGWDSYYETLEQMESYISGLFGDAIGSIADKWIESFDETGSAITDLKEISNDFAKSFAKDMLKNMLATEVFNDANTQAMLDLIKSGDMEGATAFYNNLVEQAEALGSAATGVIQSAGVQSTGESTRSATEVVKAQATQESITELNGRATAIQSHTFSINERVGNLVSITAQILGRVSSIDNKASRLEAIERSLDYMRSDISDILTKGIKVKA